MNWVYLIVEDNTNYRINAKLALEQLGIKPEDILAPNTLEEAKELASGLIDGGGNYKIILDHNLQGGFFEIWGGRGYNSTTFLKEIGLIPNNVRNVIPFSLDVIDMKLDWSYAGYSLENTGLEEESLMVNKGRVDDIVRMFEKIRLVNPENGEGDNISLS